ncbi:hypothetical protein D039_5010B, partial [Vibrio parahaemolyticus EKP-028]
IKSSASIVLSKGYMF